MNPSTPINATDRISPDMLSIKSVEVMFREGDLPSWSNVQKARREHLPTPPAGTYWRLHGASILKTSATVYFQLDLLPTT